MGGKFYFARINKGKNLNLNYIQPWHSRENIKFYLRFVKDEEADNRAISAQKYLVNKYLLNSVLLFFEA